MKHEALKKGVKVHVYTYPLTERSHEGEATILKIHFTDEPLRFCSVQFENDGFIGDRFILDKSFNFKPVNL